MSRLADQRNFETLRAWLERRRVVPFAGAGVSRAVRRKDEATSLFPDWWSLVDAGVQELAQSGRRDGADRAQSALGRGDFLTAAQIIETALGAHDWTGLLREALDQPRELAEPGSLRLATELWRLGSQYVITTNFDHVLEWVCPDYALSIGISQRAELGALAAGELDRPAVWHMHGHVHRVEEVILSGEAYRRYYGEDGKRETDYTAALHVLQSELVQKRLLFVGFSFADEHFQAELGDIVETYAGHHPGHYALLRRDEAERASELLSRLGIKELVFDDFDELPEYVAELGDLATRAPGVRVNLTLRSNFERPSTSFVGRSDERIKLQAALRHAPIVALVGSPGTGKSRLAREAALDLVGEFRGGVWLADCGKAFSAAGIAHEVAAALGETVSGQQSTVETVANVLEARSSPTLIIVDDIDGAIDHVADTLKPWSRRASAVRFLLTARDAPHLGEAPVRLEKLEAPPPDLISNRLTPELALTYPAVELLVDRVRAEREFELDERNLRDVVRIVVGLSGLPLAIELAADLLGGQTPQWLAGRIDEQIQLFEPLKAAIATSYESLDETERWAALQLSVFRGGFFVDPACEIVNLSKFGDAAPHLAIVLERLRHRSLLDTTERLGEMHYSQNEPLRHYQAERWTRKAPATAKRNLVARHAAYYARAGEGWAAAVYGPEGRDALNRLAVAFENLVAVQERAATHPDAAGSAMLALSTYLSLRGPATERAKRIERCLDQIGGPPTLRSRLGAELARAHMDDARRPRAHEAAQAAVRELDGLDGADPERANALLALGETLAAERRYEDAAAPLAAALEVYDQLGDRVARCRALLATSRPELAIGSPEVALGTLDRAQNLNAEIGSALLAAQIATTTGRALSAAGRQHEALERLDEAERHAVSIDAPLLLWPIGLLRAVAYSRLRRHEDALVLLRELEREAIVSGNLYWQAVELVNRADQLQKLQRFEAVQVAASAAVDLLKRLEDPELIAIALANQAQARLAIGEGDALGPARRAFDIAKRLGLRGTDRWLMHSTVVQAEFAAGHRDPAVVAGVVREAEKLGLPERGNAEVDNHLAALRALTTPS